MGSNPYPGTQNSAVQSNIVRKTIALTGITVRLASEDDAPKWDNYIDKSPMRTFAHRWGWATILKKSFHVKPFYFMAEAERQIVGVLPTALMKSRLFGTFLISLPWLDYGGSIADNNEVAVKLVETAVATAKENDCEFLEMRAVRQRLTGMMEKSDKREFHLDLSRGEEAVWKSFDAKARNQVRKAEKSGLSVHFGGAELMDDFYAVFSHNMRDLGTPVWPKSLFQEIFATFPDDTEFGVVRMKENTAAACLIIHYRDYSGVPSASAYRQYLNLCPNNIMYWEVIRRCIERGSVVFDFGRSSEGAGTYKFKKQWMKNPLEQIWQYQLLKRDSLPELNPHNPKFKTAIGIWRRLPVSIANFLGPKIVTKLP